MYTIVASMDDNGGPTIHAYGVFSSREDAQKVIDSMPPSRGDIDELFWLNIVKIDEPKGVDEWWLNITDGYGV